MLRQSKQCLSKIRYLYFKQGEIFGPLNLSKIEIVSMGFFHPLNSLVVANFIK
jgi:hypothetical protein